MIFAVWGDSHNDLEYASRAARISLRAGARHFIQNGDFGFTYGGIERIEQVDAVIAGVSRDLTLDFIDGNHEDFAFMRSIGANPNGSEPVQVTERIRYLPRGCRFSLGTLQCMAFGGAVSVDRNGRSIGVSYFYDEEITDAQVSRVLDGDDSKVDLMITHDVPDGVKVMEGFMERSAGTWPRDALRDSAINRRRLGMVVDVVKPDMLIHGHMHHRYADWRFGTRVIGLAHNDALLKAIIVLDSEDLERKIDV